MPPNTTTWPLDAHTRGKHLVLRQYLDAWLPIMRQSNARVLFIDAFAGPGKYSGGEDGSPIIALRALIGHNAQGIMKGEINFLFIEKEPDRCDHLIRVVQEIEEQRPENCNISVRNSTFDDTLSEVLDQIDLQNAQLAPSFVMVDPFGVSGTPMSLLERILKNPKTELYVSFMYESINRFTAHENFEKPLDELFGCPDWRDGLNIEDPTLKKDFFYGLYKGQLKESGAKHVLQFELYEGNRLVYAIFFATQNVLGCDKMKQAIWKVAPFGDYRFRGSLTDQLTFGVNVVDFTLLEQALHKEFGTKGWIRIEDVQRFVMSDQTEFHSGHLKQKTLVPMENKGEVEVKEGTRKRLNSYPNGCLLRFIKPLAGS